MKILTLNTWQERGPWRERWKVIFQGLETFRPDLVAFQEVFNGDWALEIQKRIGLPHAFLQPDKGGLVLYSRFPIQRSGTVRLAQSPLEEYQRYLLWAELSVQGKPLYFLNTHLSWKTEDGATRLQQVKEIWGQAPLGGLAPKRGQAKEREGREAILVGDLNASPETPEIKTLVKAGDLADLYHTFHPGEAGYSWDNRNPYAGGSEHKMPDRRIDFILTRGKGKLLNQPKSCDLIFTRPNEAGVFASDHFGLLTEFQ